MFFCLSVAFYRVETFHSSAWGGGGGLSAHSHVISPATESPHRLRGRLREDNERRRATISPLLFYSVVLTVSSSVSDKVSIVPRSIGS